MDTYPKVQVPVIFTDDDFLFTALGYQIPESASSLYAKRFHDGIPQFEKPLHGFWEFAEHFLENIVRRKWFRRFYSFGNAVVVIGGQIFIYQLHFRFSPSMAQRRSGMRLKISYSNGARVNTVAASVIYMSHAGICVYVLNI